MSFIINPYVFAAAAASSITMVASNTFAGTTTATITLPADIQSGDLIALYDFSDGALNGVAPSLVTPTGFTSVGSTTGNLRRSAISYKVAAGTEGGTSITGMGGADNDQIKIVLVFRGSSVITAASSFDYAGQHTSGTPTTQTVDANAGTPPLIILAAYGDVGGSGVVNVRGFSTTKDGEVASGTKVYFAWKAYITSPASTAITMNDEGNDNVMNSCYIQVTM